jgi:hypothetical protein
MHGWATGLVADRAADQGRPFFERNAEDDALPGSNQRFMCMLTTTLSLSACLCSDTSAEAYPAHHAGNNEHHVVHVHIQYTAEPMTSAHNQPPLSITQPSAVEPSQAIAPDFEEGGQGL